MINTDDISKNHYFCTKINFYSREATALFDPWWSLQKLLLVVVSILCHAAFIIQSEFTFRLHGSVLKTPVVGKAKG